jgi:hypothetical protein
MVTMERYGEASSWVNLYGLLLLLWLVVGGCS